MRIFNHLIVLGISVASINAASSVQAASFDCTKAYSRAEKAICTNNTLSRLDEEMASNYQLALNIGSSNELKEAQRKWLKKRNSCDNDNCIEQQYHYRLLELGNVFLPQSLKACTDLVIDEKITRFVGSTPGEVGGEVFVRMQRGGGFYIRSIEELPANVNADKYMFYTNDFSKGDKVKVCLTSIPEDCPVGDERGKGYIIINYKNSKRFIGTPDWHSCGGA